MNDERPLALRIASRSVHAAVMVLLSSKEEQRNVWCRDRPLPKLLKTGTPRHHFRTSGGIQRSADG